MKKGSLVMMTHSPYLYGIIIEVSWRAIWVWWNGHETKSGYEPKIAHKSIRLIK